MEQREASHGNGTSVWPTVVAVGLIVALLLGITAVGVALYEDDDPAAATTDGEGTGSGGGGTDSIVSGPAPEAIKFADTMPEGLEARDPKAPAASSEPAGTVHKLAIAATEEQLEVAPGVTQLMWTFNGEVPGPTLRGKVGDVFEITLTNEGEFGHSIDFHASKVAWDDEMRTIAPGESLVYRFEAKHAGIYMYHCGTAPALHHIAMGMYGTIIVDPPALAPVDHEFVMVQSEIYRAPDPAQPVDLNRLLNEQWDAVVFNGYANQYRDHPIRIETGDRVRVFVQNDGPSENSSFHVVGTIFDTVFKEGAYTLRPDDSRGGAQALDLQPAQGGFVEFSVDEDGLYPFVTHKFASASKGALGLFQAGEVEAPAGGGH
jgi:nitrite reductase (NO-forming)